MPNEIEDADMKIGEEDWERTDGVFKNIMDENGILWDDDDMATLPDVSDSEFDRVGVTNIIIKMTYKVMRTDIMNKLTCLMVYQYIL